MKRILIAAHKPPPFHGQSFIVQQILEGLPHYMSAKQGANIEILHLDMRFSAGIENIGRWEFGKVWLLILYVFRLVIFRFAHRVTSAYYVPAPGKQIAVIRDIALLGTMRLLGIKRVFHWQAGGLSEYLEHLPNSLFKTIAAWSYSRAALSIIPVESERKNASAFFPLKIERVHNGISDPCPDFEPRVLQMRKSRATLRESSPGPEPSKPKIFRVLFMAHCAADKGLFDAMDAVLAANDAMQGERRDVHFQLQIYGNFIDDETAEQFESRRKDERWTFRTSETDEPIQLISYKSFVSGKEKTQVFCESDVLCFPSYYAAEATPTVIIDALAHGLPVISTDWRGIPELLPRTGLPPCPIHRPDEVAKLLIEALDVKNWQDYRALYLEEFTITSFLSKFAEIINAQSTAVNQCQKSSPEEIKLVIFAHTPPPYHGQSIMVKSMIDGISTSHLALQDGQQKVTFFHVNARLSSSISDIGVSSVEKLFKLFGFCFQALWYRFAQGADTMYYIPAPQKTSAILRDWIVMSLVRPFFSKTIFQHRAIGLGLWIKSRGASPLQRFAQQITLWLMRKPDLSMVLTSYGKDDAAAFEPKRIMLVPNGKMDPCPDFPELLEPVRSARISERIRIVKLLKSGAGAGSRPCYKLLFMGLCCQTKGLFDAIRTTAACRDELAKQAIPINVRLSVAGDFVSTSERMEFDSLVKELGFNADQTPLIEYIGFLDENQKDLFLREHDLLIFPTFYEGEAMPGVILEAMAYGMDVVTTNWREVNMLLPSESCHTIDPGDVDGFKKQILTFMDKPAGHANRKYFLENYTYEGFIAKSIEAFRSICSTRRP